MIVVTGGAGFIGSALIWELNNRGISDIIVVDHLGHSEKWRNLVPLHFKDYIDKKQFIQDLESNCFKKEITALFHLGACSATTQTDADYLIDNNYKYTLRIASWWSGHPECRFMYASSAATYGDGERGYEDDEKKLADLRPLNMYGYSKHLFDLYAQRKGWLNHCVGLKYFNVFGPNEYHKADMRSLICKAFPTIRQTGTISLFKSHHTDYNDGEQCRDFIYVKDAVAMTLFFLDHRNIGGIYNIGTGRARTWNDVAKAMFAALGMPVRIEYVSMPPALQDKYQYYTRAQVHKLHTAGCAHTCMKLEDAIDDYCKNYLLHNNVLEPIAL